MKKLTPDIAITKISSVVVIALDLLLSFNKALKISKYLTICYTKFTKE